MTAADEHLPPLKCTRKKGGCWLPHHDAGTWFIDPGSPWQNAWIECFNGRLRDQHVNDQLLDSLLGTQALTED